MSWKWYGVKTLYRTDASGAAKNTDADYSDDSTLIEERIVLFKARSFHEAIAKAELEAKSYATGTHKNVYRQTVRARYLKSCDAFELFDEPGAGIEVFSSTEVVSRSVSDKQVVDQCFGQIETDGIERTRRKFLNTEMQDITNSQLKKLIN